MMKELIFKDLKGNEIYGGNFGGPKKDGKTSRSRYCRRVNKTILKDSVTKAY